MRIKCAACGCLDLEPGFVMDSGQSARGFTAWVAGALERGLFGGAKLMGRDKYVIEAFRCRQCAFLNHYAREMV
ncbi:hypothetical protein ACFPM7_19285 [Actinokineospora guangxiensis]|uniref:Uncharacterized protein n=1 Tax=Actinokineospora guangxiensis TaxID=1490288 RepID=A0ABW0ET26_9PSEU